MQSPSKITSRARFVRVVDFLQILELLVPVVYEKGRTIYLKVNHVHVVVLDGKTRAIPEREMF